MSAVTAAPSAPSAWAPLHRRAFRRLWLAQLVSNVGVWMQTVGAQWFLVEHTDSSALVAWAQTASLLPVLLLSLPAGVLADQLDRRRLLVVTTVTASALVVVLAVLSLGDWLTPGSLLGLTFLIGCASALGAPAWQAIQPELVPREELSSASALGSVAVNAARAVGPALAGLVIALTGPSAVFVLNAASFVLVIGALLAWRRPAGEDTGRERAWWAISAGVHYVANGPVVRRILLRSALFAFPASALWALLPDAARRQLGLGADGYGALLGLLGVGSLLGVAAMPTLRRRVGPRALLAGSALLFGLGTLAVALAPLAVVVPLLVLSGMAWIATLTTLNAGMQLTLAGWVRARGMAVYLLVFMGSQALGSLLWGALSHWVGTVPTLLVGAALLGACAASVRPLPLRPETGRLDRSVAGLCRPEPALLLDPDPDDGPVLVVRTYEVPAEQRAAFVEAMRPVEQSRRRTGATSWRLYGSLEQEAVLREEFTVRSWEEHQRQRTQRWTGHDRDLVAAASVLAARPPTEEHYVPARDGRVLHRPTAP